MDFWKRKIPILIVLVTGITMILVYYLPMQWTENTLTGYSKWYQIIASFALIVGVFGLTKSHITKIVKQRAGWGYSVAMIISMLAMVFAALLGGGIESGTAYMWIFDNLYTPLSSTVFSLIAFYIASAAFRAFRARTFEAALMLIVAIIVMLGRIPFGEVISGLVPDKLGFLRLDNITQWLFLSPVVAARRAILLGIALSSIATSIRIILGIERTYMGGAD